MTQENKAFGADVSRLLEIVTHALYSNRDVFLRELVSNGADACDRLRYDSIQNPDLAKEHSGYEICIDVDAPNRLVIVEDTGIGMTEEEMIDHLGTIAKSGTRALMEQLKSQGSAGAPSLIGQFGVGFYSAFMVADKVTVISRKAGSNDVWTWESDGVGGFITYQTPAEDAAKLRTTSGTRITLHIKDDASEYLLEEKLKRIVVTYSNHINLPIYVGTTEEEPVNTASALWMRPKSDITTEQYQEFFAMVSGAMGLDQPSVTAHWHAEGKIDYTALLFIPTLRPFDLYDPTRRHSVRLYVRRIFITDECEGLMYPWLRFVRGVIDSEDLPLNISREMLQQNAVVHKIRSSVAKKLLGDLDKLSRDDAVAFSAFWHQFGAVVKEGLYDAVEHREDIFKICRFFTTHSETGMASLEDYVARMKDGQDSIYYISGENVESMRNSPQIEGLKKRGLEVLLFKDTIDDFWLPVVMDFKGKKFVSVTKGAIDLSKFPLEQKEKAENDNDGKPEERAARAGLISYLSSKLSDRISSVRVSDRLTESPVCLVASEKDVDLHMGRVLKIHQHYEANAKPVLEINAAHPLIARLDEIAGNNADSGLLADAAELLYDQALIIQGEPVKDPSGFARRMASFLSKGLAA
ncbi:MAG TPA: molecular chaperone HtpG [Alphaproteobacteria bacterium]|nr:molecular chaperone HtpG [Alphaproteobacteria bacterium]HNS44874.1 molecular chaperone HtpG [Alphaproteobacteria bacterium]